MTFSVALEAGRTACVESIESFVRAVESFSEHDLLGPSRCHGWSRLEVVAHVIAGWQEMLGGLVSRVEAEPTVDAGSYWPAFAEDYGDEDPVLVVMSQRRRASAFARPASAVAQLNDVAKSLLRGVRDCGEINLHWDGHVFTPGDFLAVWAVEDVVHQLDLMCDEPAAASALSLARRTTESLVGEQLPAGWSDSDATLIGTGRLPVPPGSGLDASRFPALG